MHIWSIDPYFSPSTILTNSGRTRDAKMQQTSQSVRVVEPGVLPSFMLAAK